MVRTLGSLMSYVEEGTKARKTASTLQNPSSSRSHALLTIAVTPETSGVPVGAGSSASGSRRRSEPSTRGGSKLRLVDRSGRQRERGHVQRRSSAQGESATKNNITGSMPRAKIDTLEESFRKTLMTFWTPSFLEKHGDFIFNP